MVTTRNLNWMTIQERKWLNLFLFFKSIIDNLPFFSFLSSTYLKLKTFLAELRQKFTDLVQVLLKNWSLTPSWHSPTDPRPDPWSPWGTWPGPWSMVTRIKSYFLPIGQWSRPDNWRQCYGLFTHTDYSHTHSDTQTTSLRHTDYSNHQSDPKTTPILT